MKISEIMSTDVMTVTMDNTVEEIRALFEQNDCHHILIVSDSNMLLGIISDRDVLRSLCPDADSSMANNHASKTLQRKAHQIMTRDVVTIRSGNDIEDAAQIMLEKKISCLPVVDEGDVMEGIVTKTDLLECMCRIKSAAES
jgi:acetoin utilization protein AcuB